MQARQSSRRLLRIGASTEDSDDFEVEGTLLFNQKHPYFVGERLTGRSCDAKPIGSETMMAVVEGKQYARLHLILVYVHSIVPSLSTVAAISSVWLTENLT
jgi:hypothetical protein